MGNTTETEEKSLSERYNEAVSAIKVYELLEAPQIEAPQMPSIVNSAFNGAAHDVNVARTLNGMAAAPPPRQSIGNTDPFCSSRGAVRAFHLGTGMMWNMDPTVRFIASDGEPWRVDLENAQTMYANAGYDHLLSSDRLKIGRYPLTSKVFIGGDLEYRNTEGTYEYPSGASHLDVNFEDNEVQVMFSVQGILHPRISKDQFWVTTAGLEFGTQSNNVTMEHGTPEKGGVPASSNYLHDSQTITSGVVGASANVSFFPIPKSHILEMGNDFEFQKVLNENYTNNGVSLAWRPHIKLYNGSSIFELGVALEDKSTLSFSNSVAGFQGVENQNNSVGGYLKFTFPLGT